MDDLAALQACLARWLEEFAAVADGVGAAEAAPSLRADLAAAFADPVLRVVVCGEFNTGKSTLINALVGQPDLLATDALPCTSYVTAVELAGPARSADFFECRGGRELPLTREQFLTLQRRDRPDPEIERLVVRTPAEGFGGPVALVDTPGLEDLSQARTDVTLGYLPKADVVLLIIDAVQGVKRTERRFVREHLSGTGARRTVAVLNLIDRLNGPKEVEAKLAACRKALSDELSDVPWAVTCGWNAVQALREGLPTPDESGVPALRAEVRRIAVRDRRRLVAARFVRPAGRRLAELEARIAAEEAGLAASLQETEAKVTDFRRRVAEAAARNDAVFRNARQRVAAAIDELVDKSQRRLADFVRDALNEVNGLGGIAQIRQFVESDVPGRKLAGELTRLCRDFEAALTKAIVDAFREVLEPGLVVVTLPTPSGELSSAESVRCNPPWQLYQAFEVVLRNLLEPRGPVVLLLERLGLGKLANAVPLLAMAVHGLTLAGLRAAVARTLHELPERASAALRGSAETAARGVFDTAAGELELQVAAVEEGLEAARALLAAGRSQSDRRKAELTEMRIRLDTLRKGLAAAVGGADGGSTS